MTNTLQFWRDVEIFNIPDAPKPEPTSREDAKDTLHPRSAVVQRFAVADLRRAKHAGRPLPWHDPRFQIQEDDAVVADPVDENDADDGPRMPASYAHVVYLGVGPKQRFLEFILRTHAITPTADEIYRPATGYGWLAGVIVNGGGNPLPRTYVAASFAVGSSLLKNNRSLDLALTELQARAAAFDERMDERRQLPPPGVAGGNGYALTVDDLIAEWEQVHQPLGGASQVDAQGALGPSIVIESVPLYRRKDDTLNPAPEQAATLLNSFFIEDLTTLINSQPADFGAALGEYLGPDSADDARLDLLADPAALARHAGAALIPAGRWVAPPKEHLSLAQQTAVYQILDQVGQADGERSRGLMAVNGPPGTGKTTLLKDIIAEVVVRRAQRLCALNEPDDLFDGDLTVNKRGNDTARAPAVRADIVAGTEIVVTSSNNAAVQNISFELPFACDRQSFPAAAYFADTAAFLAEKFQLPRKNPWGLLSAALGAKPNRDKVASSLIGYEQQVQLAKPETHPVAGQPASLKPWLDLANRKYWANDGSALRAWRVAKQDFQQRQAAVEALRAGLVLVQEALAELPRLATERGALEHELAQLQRELAAVHAGNIARQASDAADEQHDQAMLHSLGAQHVTQQAMHRDLEHLLAQTSALNDPGWLARVLNNVFGVETKGWIAYRDKVEPIKAAVTATVAELAANMRERARLEAQTAQRVRQSRQAAHDHALAVQAQSSAIATAQQSLAAVSAHEAALQERLAMAPPCSITGERPCLPDAAFIALPPDKRHIVSLWMTAQLEQARAELFVSALRLHETTVLASASSWQKALRVLREFLVNQALPTTPADRAALWRSLFFIVPVVSTTLASFGRLFEGLAQESLGWVLIDEAGQATPASVAGAVWRARRAVLVGDPLQIEPVVTVPHRLVESLGRHRGLEPEAVTRWSPTVQSAQTIADRTMCLGAMVEGVWTGLPLRTHRRCMSPMFEISNSIAYDNQMVQATRPKGIDPDLFASSWIDVRGEASGKVVDAQVAALQLTMATLLANWPQVVNEDGTRAPASVYVISPFRDVSNACKGVIGAESALGRQFKKRKLVVDVGTVHTFQGKEASIVFMVLGSAPGKEGDGSRRWASGKPNLLNVAVTRAQQRFYVIGNYEDWAECPYFREMAQAQGHMRRTVIVPAEDGKRIQLVPADAATEEASRRAPGHSRF